MNGIRTSQSYCIWLSDGHSVMTIECAKGWLVADSVIEARWKEALQGMWTTVVSRLIDRSVEDLRNGKGFVIGPVRFDKDGLHKDGRYSSMHRSILRGRARVRSEERSVGKECRSR